MSGVFGRAAKDPMSLVARNNPGSAVMSPDNPLYGNVMARGLRANLDVGTTAPAAPAPTAAATEAPLTRPKKTPGVSTPTENVSVARKRLLGQ
jgi:hypothetical protein